VSADAHPVHLHLVHFEVVSRHEISYDTAVYTQATATGVFNSVLDLDEFLPQGDGIYVTEQPIVQHNGEIGSGRKIVYPNNFCGGSTRSGCYDPNPLDSGPEYVETGPMVSRKYRSRMNALLMNCKIFSWFLFANQQDVVTALPNQVTKIRMLFDRPGRYVWHCHILSHEDHEMMRVLQVGPE
jgi:FtsP/CotA-like multicopper oxidase with cupredoxin domain